MVSNPHGLPVEPSVALLFLAAVAAAWRWLRSGEDDSGRRRASGRPAPQTEVPPSPPFRRHRAPNVGFATPRYVPRPDLRPPAPPTSITPPPEVAGHPWNLEPRPPRERWEKRFRFRR